MRSHPDLAAALNRGMRAPTPRDGAVTMALRGRDQGPRIVEEQHPVRSECCSTFLEDAPTKTSGGLLAPPGTPQRAHRDTVASRALRRPLYRPRGRVGRMRRMRARHRLPARDQPR